MTLRARKGSPLLALTALAALVVLPALAGCTAPLVGCEALDGPWLLVYPGRPDTEHPARSFLVELQGGDGERAETPLGPAGCTAFDPAPGTYRVEASYREDGTDCVHVAGEDVDWTGERALRVEFHAGDYERRCARP